MTTETVTVETDVQWDDPTGKRHEPGEVAEIDPVVVFDLPDLVKSGTVRIKEKPPVAQAATKKDK